MSTPTWNDPQGGYGHPRSGYGGGPEYGGAPGYGGQYGYGPYTGYAPPGPPLSPHGRPLADWGSRAAAALIDSLIVTVMVIGIMLGGLLLCFGTAYLIDPEASSSVWAFAGIGMFLFVLAAMAAGFCYRWLHHARTGQTPAKRWMNIQVVSRDTGLPPTKGLSFVRELIYILFGQVGVVGLLDVLWPLWDEQRQSIHDKAAATLVVTVPPAAPNTP
ncbi:RDD family protein [Nocardiopsis mangrovi]|uniref:RDD family protein n=1 Tax=Nocardiopsis mangrovi TaxID=1179818 RepID=A0ABV9DNR6_9ACTN